MKASISPPAAQTARFFLVLLAVSSFTADVADGQECASPFGTHDGADLKYCVLKAEHAATDPDPCVGTSTSGSVTAADNRCRGADTKCELHSVVDGGTLPWSSWMEYYHVKFVTDPEPAASVKLPIGNHPVQCQVSGRAPCTRSRLRARCENQPSMLWLAGTSDCSPSNLKFTGLTQNMGQL
jgi:hypothetical protein